MLKYLYRAECIIQYYIDIGVEGETDDEKGAKEERSAPKY